MQAIEDELDRSKQSIEDAADALERAALKRERRERDSHGRLAAELRNSRPRGRSGISGSQR